MNKTRDMDNLIGRLRRLFSSMEESYDKVAASYGFNCMGCKDNCCTQRFHHHTLSEYYYLLEGIKTADKGKRDEILDKSPSAATEYEKGGSPMCPVNFDGLCGLYEHRPMICRLHGLPHEFMRPDGVKVLGGGCRRFDDKNMVSGRLDRTPFYTELALIEKELRVAVGFEGAYKKTTALMLLDMAAELRK